ncbi:MAG TPA: prenyltransferase/squalene oxidase repeat-containing protein [Phycisphaerales bacterium]|nr:prenyltransferase/squalene oxidase repeat-containing protein [Phycisphaerales bacterium]
MNNRFFTRAALSAMLCVIAGCASPQATSDAVLTNAGSDVTAQETTSSLARHVDRRAAYETGLAFLIGHQNADGSWGTFESSRPYEIYRGTVASFRAFRDATSALCVMALIEPSRENEAAWSALVRGVDFLIAAEPVGRATPDAFYDTWTLTYGLRAYAHLYMDDRFADRREELAKAITGTIDLLARRQGADGGWGYYDFGQSLERPSGLMSNSFNTASVLLAFDDAMRAGFEVNSAMIRDSLRCVERLRLPSGAFIYGTGHRWMPGANFNQVKGSLARSQPCNLALWVFKRDISKDQIKQSLNDLRSHHHFLTIAYGRPRPHEAWYQNSGYYFYYGHFYAATIAHALDAAAAREFLDWQSQMVANLQNADGSWYDFPMYGYHRAYGTAYALMILREAWNYPTLASVQSH